jgi:hypothetical protein
MRLIKTHYSQRMASQVRTFVQTLVGSSDKFVFARSLQKVGSSFRSIPERFPERRGFRQGFSGVFALPERFPKGHINFKVILLLWRARGAARLAEVVQTSYRTSSASNPCPAKVRTGCPAEPLTFRCSSCAPQKRAEI